VRAAEPLCDRATADAPTTTDDERNDDETDDAWRER
jgi:hypothetical protein